MAGMVVTVAVALQGEMAGMEETEEAGLRVVMAATVATVAMAIVLIRLGGMAVMEGMGAIAVTMGKEEKELQERMELMVEMDDRFWLRPGWSSPDSPGSARSNLPAVAQSPPYRQQNSEQARSAPGCRGEHNLSATMTVSSKFLSWQRFRQVNKSFDRQSHYHNENYYLL
jgi:hypothetical protein